MKFISLQQSPIIVRIIEPHKTSVADVLIGALGITGVLVLIAAVLGVVVGGVLFWMRWRR